jgi:hypothetical protein
VVLESSRRRPVRKRRLEAVRAALAVARTRRRAVKVTQARLAEAAGVTSLLAA